MGHAENIIYSCKKPVVALIKHTFMQIQSFKKANQASYTRNCIMIGFGAPVETA